MDQHRQIESLLDLTDQFFMNQMITEPTRNDNILDLFFANDEEVILKIEIEPQTILSDHKLQLITTCFNQKDEYAPSQNANGFKMLNFNGRDVDWKTLNEKLTEVEWKKELENRSTHEIHQFLLQTLLKSCLDIVPRRTERRKSIIPRERRILMRRRGKLRKQILYCNSRSTVKLSEEILKIEHKIQDSHISERKKQEEMAISKIKDNPRYFYQYARSKSTVKTAVGPFINAENQLIFDSKEKSDILQKQYTSVYSSEGYNPSIIEDISRKPGLKSLTTIEVTEENIEAAINTLNTTSASGPDGVPAILLKNCKSALKLPLKILWRSSLENGMIPQELKLGSIVPIYKGGDRGVPSNYRPVALTSHQVKICEKVIVAQMVEYLNEANLLNDHQHGFRKK